MTKADILTMIIFLPIFAAIFDEWCECEFAGLCPHSYEDDDQFSFRCLNAFCGFKLAKYKTITEAANCNGVSVRDFAKFRKVKGLKV